MRTKFKSGGDQDVLQMSLGQSIVAGSSQTHSSYPLRQSAFNAGTQGILPPKQSTVGALVLLRWHHRFPLDALSILSTPFPVFGPFGLRDHKANGSRPVRLSLSVQPAILPLLTRPTYSKSLKLVAI